MTNSESIQLNNIPVNQISPARFAEIMPHRGARLVEVIEVDNPKEKYLLGFVSIDNLSDGGDARLVKLPYDLLNSFTPTQPLEEPEAGKDRPSVLQILGLDNYNGYEYKPVSETVRESWDAVGNLATGVAEVSRGAVKISKDLVELGSAHEVRRKTTTAIAVGALSIGAIKGLSLTGVTKAEVSTPENKVTEQEFINFSYTTSQSTTLRNIADNLFFPLPVISELNPDFKPDEEVPSGTEIFARGMAGVINVEAEKKDALIENIAENSGLSPDAIKSASERIESNNDKIVKVAIPGRIAIEQHTNGDQILSEVAEKLDVAESQLSTLSNESGKELIVAPFTNLLTEEKLKYLNEIVDNKQDNTLVITNPTSTTSTTSATTTSTTTIESNTTTSTSSTTSIQSPETTKSPSSTTSEMIEKMTDSEFITWLANQVNITAEDYKKFDVDISREDAFKTDLSGEKIRPTKFIGHWTGALYKNVDHFISSIKAREGKCCSVMYFMDRDAKVYRFTDSDEKNSHAKGSNYNSQGVEIEARGLKDYTPAQMNAFVMTAYRFMSANDIPIERQNFLGHSELKTGKPDMPKELVDVLFPKLAELAQTIKNQEDDNLENKVTNQPNQDTATTIPASNQTSPEVDDSTKNEQEQKKYNDALKKLLDLIAEGEGNWDSFNRGSAGDSIGHKFITNERKLTEFTIADVLKLQQAKKVFAVGRYQFVPDTLKSAVASTQIDVNRLFDSTAQNELAVSYLLLTKRTALAGYIKGEHNNVSLALNDIAKEWASLPYNFGNGVFRSFYHGKANNSAKGGKELYEQVKNCLEELQVAYLEVKKG